MNTFLGKLSARGFLYAVVGLFVLGGLVVVPHFARAIEYQPFNYTARFATNLMDIGDDTVVGPVVTWTHERWAVTNSWELQRWDGSSVEICIPRTYNDLTASPTDFSTLATCGNGNYFLNIYTDTGQYTGIVSISGSPIDRSYVNILVTDMNHALISSTLAWTSLSIYKLLGTGGSTSCGSLSSIDFGSGFDLNALYGTCSGDGEYYLYNGDSGLNHMAILFSYSGNWYGGIVGVPADTSTHFVSLTPVGGTTVSTTTDIGYDLFVNSVDWVAGMQVKMTFTQPSEFACLNSGAVYDAIFGCTGANAPAPSFSTTTYPITALSGESWYSTTVTFPKGGKWVGTFELRKPTYWGLFSEVVISSTTPFTIGQPSYMDIVQASLASTSLAQRANHGASIYNALASTTDYLKTVCNPLSYSSFDLGSCVAGMIIPPAGGLADDLTILKQLPPWGYAFRVYDIFTATTSTSTAQMPQINYSFATGTPLASDIGSIHFDPFGSIVQAGTLINEMKSDRSDSKTVWDIMNPFITAFVYLALGFMIFHDLTGIHSHASNNQEKNT